MKTAFAVAGAIALVAAGTASVEAAPTRPAGCREGNPDAVYRVDLGTRIRSQPVAERIGRGGGYPFDISPDGRFVVYGQARELRIAPTAGGGSRLVATIPGLVGAARWSPDGARIVFVGGDPFGPPSPLWLVNGDGTHLREIGRRAIGPASWAHDGRSIAYVSRLGAGNDTARLFLRRLDRPAPLNVAPASYDIGRRVAEPMWSPRGDWIAYSGQLLQTVELIRPDGSGHRVLRSGVVPDPSWSPDGTSLAFDLVDVGSPARPDYLVVDTLGRRIHTVDTHARGLAYSYFPTWSPTAPLLAYAGSTAIDGETQLFVSRPDGSAPRRVSADRKLPGVGTSGSITRIVWVTKGPYAGRRIFYFRSFCVDDSD